MLKQGSLRTVWLCNIFINIGHGIISPITPSLLYNRGLSALEIGIFASVGALLTVILSVTMGVISNRLGIKRVIFLSVAMSFISIFFFPFTFGFQNLMIIYLVYRASWSIYCVLITIWVVNLSRDFEAGASYGFFKMGDPIGWMVGVLVGGVLLELFNFTPPYILAAIILLSSSFIFYLIDEGPKINYNRKMEFSSILKKKFIALLIIVFISMIALPAHNVFLPLFMEQEIGATPFIRSFAIALGTLGEIPATLYLGRLSDKIGRKKVIALCLLAYPIRYLLTITFTDPLVVSSIQLFQGLTYGGLCVTLIASISDVFSKDLRGSAIGFYTAILGISQMSGSFILGFISDNMGFQTMYIFSAIIPLISFAILPLIKKEKKQELLGNT